MTRFDKIAVSLLKPINPSFTLILGVYTVLWGLWLLNPFWTVFTQAPLYSAMAGVAWSGVTSEVFWGSLAVISGLVICRGAIKPSFANIQLGAFVGAIQWLVVAIMYFIGDWQNTGGITSLAFCVYATLVWVNTKVNRTHFKS